MDVGTVRCPGCGGVFPDVQGPTHRYMTSVPGCWDAFGEVVGREFSGWWIGEVHRLVVDTYAVQHPGDGSPQAVQSVGLHLVALHLTLVEGVRQDTVVRVLQAGAKGPVAFTPLAPPVQPAWKTVSDVLPAEDLRQHEDLARAWAASAWEGWRAHHAQVHAWADELLGLVRRGS